jgi:hypothetical protein
MTEREPILALVPFGGALSALLRLLLGDQREEFEGDLVEEARLRLRFSSRRTMAAWIWMQALRSVPSLLVLRARRWLARPLTPALAGRPFSPGGRALPLSLAVSLSVHAVLVLMAVSWAFFREDELEAPRPREIAMAVFPEAAAPETPVVAPAAQELPQVRRARRRMHASTEPTPRIEPMPPAELPVAVIPVTVPSRPAPPVRVPIAVAEKQCVSCPAPQLPPAFARLGVEQQMLVKTCVGINGEVTSVDVLRGFDSNVSARVTETVRGWRLTPYALDGHPVPFCYPTRFIFASR